MNSKSITLNERQTAILKAMLKQDGEMDTYRATGILWGNVNPRKYRMATGNFMRGLADKGLVHWTTRNTGVRGSIVYYTLTEKGEKLIQSIK